MADPMSPTPTKAEPDSDRDWPFYELKFIIRVLSHEGSAPRSGWRVAHGMAHEIFRRWHATETARLANKGE